MNQSKSLATTIDERLKELRKSYALATKELEAERATLTSDSQTLETLAEELKRKLPARMLIAQYEAAQLTVAGKDEEAALKLAELEKMMNAPQAMAEKQREIAARVEAIDKERQSIARRVFFDSAFDDIRAPLVAHSQILAEAHDYAWQGILDFAHDTGTASSQPSLLVAGLKYRLTANDRGPEKALFEKLLEWFGGTANERKLP